MNPQLISHQHRTAERGNMLFMILIAVVLIGILTAVIMNTGGGESANIDEETLVLRTSEAQRYTSELERAVLFIVHNGHSESDIRFAHPDAASEYGDLSADVDPTDQVFHQDGGAANYKAPPEAINDGSPWEFYGGTALPGVGSDRADLVAVLPNVTAQFCARINRLDGQSGTPTDTGGSLASGAAAGDCVNMGEDGRFGDIRQFYATPNTTNTATFEQDPQVTGVRTALEACVHCAADGKDHFYHVLLAR
jgi:type II secretory pathway pseudopilin PulG